MSVNQVSIKNLRSHWALSALSDAELARASEVVNERLVERAIGQHIEFAFTESAADDELLRRVSLAYEMAAIEGLDKLSRTTNPDTTLSEQSGAAAYCVFDMRRLLTVPESAPERVYHILHLSALAYCGDRWSDLRRWYRENDEALVSPSVADCPWDRRLLYRLFECWVRLFRKNGWNDLDQIHEIIAGLREDQKTYESGVLNTEAPKGEVAQTALRLVALYHWAKATEVLAEYMLQGSPQGVYTLLDKHFEAATSGATASTDAQLEILLRWLHASGHVMVANSVWWATRTVNSRVTECVRSITKREHQALFELLPPQRAALLEQGLLDQAKTAIVIDMPTSGGKTLLAQFRTLQALNQFSADKGWVAYVAPTRALSAQITRRLRRDFGPIGIRVEQLSGAVEVDAFEEQLLAEAEQPFSVLVATPEKLSLVIRNKKVSRPLALVVMDEAHNIETESRGLRIELLLATVKRDCPSANFLLLMPYVESAETLARWLAQDINAGHAISFGSTAWKPNERIIGTYRVVADDSQKAGWRLLFETLTVTGKALEVQGVHNVGTVKPLDIPKSGVIGSGKQKGLGLQTAAMAAIMSERGTSIAVGQKIDAVWNMARHAAGKLAEYDVLPPDVKLAQDFLRTEVSPDFELVGMLGHGVGVHHAGLSDEIRTMMEWLAESGSLKVLCATSTIAQGINFPVSSIFLTSRFVPQGRQSLEMSPREFWNLAGRAGRMGHDSVGVVGLAEGEARNEISEFVSRATGALASRLVVLLDELEAVGRLNQLPAVIYGEQWEDFRCYVAHLWAEKKNLDSVLGETEQLLRHTYGYGMLRASSASKDKADALLNATQSYARSLAQYPGAAELADATGFSPEGVRRALAALNNLENKLTPADWAPQSIFGDGGSMADLFGVMLKVPQLAQSLKDVGGPGMNHEQLANITLAWVNGTPLDQIAQNFFANEGGDDTSAFTAACRAIYRSIVNSGTWGISALSRVSGIDFETLPEADRRRINNLPAMIYHGVKTEEAVLMRMNSVPRSAAEKVGQLFKDTQEQSGLSFSVGNARRFLKNMSAADWNASRPQNAALSGGEYKRVWEVLSGETA